MALKPPSQDFYLEVSRGNVDGAITIHRFGHNFDIDTSTTPETISTIGGAYVPPNSGQAHTVTSTSTGDAGSVLSSGTWDNKSLTTIVDADATFSSDGVAVGDAVINDTTQDHSFVISVDSETQLTLSEMHHRLFNSAGDTYRVVRTLGTGAAIVHISNGLDSGFNIQEEFVVLNGTGAVTLANEYARINDAHIHAVGSAKFNGGDIRISGSADLVETAHIPYRQGETETTFYTVPNGKDIYVADAWADLNAVSASPAGAYADLGLYQSVWSNLGYGYHGGWRNRHGFTVSLEAGGRDHPFTPPLKFSSKTDMWIQADLVSNNDTDLSAGFSAMLIDR